MLLKNLVSLINLQLILSKEMFKMTFTKNSMIAQSYVILILAEEITFEQVPNVGNLRAVVLDILGAEAA